MAAVAVGASGQYSLEHVDQLHPVQYPAQWSHVHFKSVTATMEVPELAVYSNFALCGVIQIAGAKYPGFGSAESFARTFTRPYQIYIPPQFLVVGNNQLQISALGSRTIAPARPFWDSPSTICS